VEDEEGVRELIAVDGAHGYAVLTAGNSVGALDLAEQFPGRIDLLTPTS
jgi:hypothetical protein